MNAGGVDKACKSSESVRSTDARIYTDIGRLRATTRINTDIFYLCLSVFLSVFISVPALCAG